MQNVIRFAALVGISSLWLHPAMAQKSTPESAAERATMQSQTPGGTWSTIEAQVKNTLEQAGYKNIQVMPSSFVVRAEKDGRTLTLVVSSESDKVTYLPTDGTGLEGQQSGGQPHSMSSGEQKEAEAVLGDAPNAASFIKEAAGGDMFEIQSSQLAISKTQGDVQAFAEQMVKDHTKTSDELKTQAQKANVQIPPDMSSSQQTMLDKLRSLSGNDFTKQYLDDQVKAHKEAVSLFVRFGKDGDNDQLKQWASQTLPTLRHHLEMAQDLNK